MSNRHGNYPFPFPPFLIDRNSKSCNNSVPCFNKIPSNIRQQNKSEKKHKKTTTSENKLMCRLGLHKTKKAFHPNNQRNT